jgi:hypothetical protein
MNSQVCKVINRLKNFTKELRNDGERLVVHKYLCMAN